MVSVREVYKLGIYCNSASIIVAHNHPSGNPSPSREDREITKRLSDSGDILGIKVLDHLIIGSDSYYSFKEHEEV